MPSIRAIHSLQSRRRALTLLPQTNPPASIAGLSRGIDTSFYQGLIDWQDVAASGVAWSSQKAVQYKIDPNFVRDFKAAKAAGLPRSPYDFYNPEIGPRSQVALALDAVDRAGGLDATDLPFMIDLEAAHGQTGPHILDGAADWALAMYRATGRRPLLYSSRSFIVACLGTATAVSQAELLACKMWTAHYGVEVPRVAPGWAEWSFWQWGTSFVPGVLARVDSDVFRGDNDALKTFIVASNPPMDLGGQLADTEPPIRAGEGEHEPHDE